MTVYFIQAGSFGPVKIGHAEDVAGRLRELQTAHWETLTVIRTLDGSAAVERWLHRRFAGQHIRGEWFGYSHDMHSIEVPAVEVLDTQDFPLQHAIDAAGSQKALAARIGRSQQAISKWLRGRVPAEEAVEIERVTGISRHALRPDLFGPAPKRKAA